MKLVYVVTCILLLFRSVECENMEIMAMFMENCQQKFPVTDDEFNMIVTDHTSNVRASDNLKCYAKCMLEHRGWVIEDDLVDDIFFTNYFHPSEFAKFENKIPPIVKECRLLVSADKCDRVFRVYHCYKDKLEKIMFPLKKH
ncbi:general odorant-binding protein 56d-like [Stomoxys calcitrans]|uniref:general odorant-binding protein 56d-like n=1 Tax=Stomoxys calcitrans TaxID=35570 RepID=UPI0027E28B1E|nr:general odorant-binding protein 56d-like [Stomoxys calcitrans]